MIQINNSVPLAVTDTFVVGVGGTINIIAPGITMTEMISSMSDEVIEHTANSTALGRCGDPREIASVAAYLLSDFSSYITGQTIRVDGGM